MRVHRLHLGGLVTGQRRLRGAAAHHLARVLRVRAGATVVAFDGDGFESIGRVTSVEADEVVLEFGEVVAVAPETDRPLTLAVALLKGDKLADVVRMGTELGVTAFRPFIAKRCDVRELGAGKRGRLERIASEAARQSGRARVPTVDAAVPAGSLAWSGAALIADPSAELAWRELPAFDDRALTVITGPEGGLTEEEIASFGASGATAVRLGRRTLRAETAPIAVAAAVLLAGEP